MAYGHLRVVCAWVFVVAAIVSIGCGQQLAESSVDFDSYKTLEQAISGGVVSAADHTVVGLVSVDGHALGACTGTLISRNVVLTAQHCVADIRNSVGDGVDCARSRFGSIYQPSGLYITLETRITQRERDYYAVKDVLVPPGDRLVCGQDVALVILAQPFAKDVDVSVPRIDESLTPGVPYSAVGYGATDDAGNGSGVRRRRDDLSVFCVAEDCPYLYSSTSTEWVGDEGVCQGDSGGPAFDLKGRVIGVASRGSFGCGSPVYGDVTGWGDWLKKSTRDAARIAGIDAPLWSLGWPTDPVYSYSVGDDCRVSNDCDSGLCVDGYCSRRCIAEAPCPLGYTCDSSLSQCMTLEFEDDGVMTGDSVVAGCAVLPFSNAGVLPIVLMVFLGLGGLRRRR